MIHSCSILSSQDEGRLVKFFFNSGFSDTILAFLEKQWVLWGGGKSRILNKSCDVWNPHFPYLPNGYNNLLPTALWGSREDKTKSLSKATLSDLVILGAKEAYIILKTSRVVK